MFPLIEITTVPIEIKVTTKNAQLEYTRGTAEMEVSRDDKGGVSIKSRPIKLKMDTFEARNLPKPATVRNPGQGSEKVKAPQASYEATATYAQNGKLLLEGKVGQEMLNQYADEALRTNVDPTQAQAQAQAQAPAPAAKQQALDLSIDTTAQFQSPEDADAPWEDGGFQIQYEMDKLNFDWKIDSGEFKFTPGDIEISVEQQPDVIIKYVGGPIYVPPSADPNYEPVDVKV